MDKKTVGMIGLIIIVAIATFWFNQDEQDQSNHYYIYKLDGESENWDLNQYQVEFVPTNHTAGRGTLQYTGDNGPIIDSINFTAMALIDGTEITLQSESIHEPVDASEIRIGLIDNSIFKPNGDPVMFHDVKEIYVLVEWMDSKGNYQEERLDLYQFRE